MAEKQGRGSVSAPSFHPTDKRPRHLPVPTTCALPTPPMPDVLPTVSAGVHGVPLTCFPSSWIQGLLALHCFSPCSQEILQRTEHDVFIYKEA